MKSKNFLNLISLCSLMHIPGANANELEISQAMFLFFPYFLIMASGISLLILLQQWEKSETQAYRVTDKSSTSGQITNRTT